MRSARVASKDCCCLPFETYGRNGVTQIFRSFHRTPSSTTCGTTFLALRLCVCSCVCILLFCDHAGVYCCDVGVYVLFWCLGLFCI